MEFLHYFIEFLHYCFAENSFNKKIIMAFTCFLSFIINIIILVNRKCNSN